MTNLVITSLELAAETGVDVTPLIYDRYFDNCPGSKALMSHIDDLVRGKMMEEVMRVLMVDDYKDEQSYLNFEVNNHALAYSVEPHMYKNLLDAVKAVVKETIADQWTDDFEKAWDDRIAALSHEIEIRQPA